MDMQEMDQLVVQLSAGFELLQYEYCKLHGQHHALERKLATAREQYNEIAKLYGAVQTATPPLSLSSSSAVPREAAHASASILDLLNSTPDQESKEAATRIKTATTAALTLRNSLRPASDSVTNVVRIWSGPSADRQERSSSMMPSISESPLEQDFTVEGKPSKLGCPFSSMAKKKLSSHAASVLSRYNYSNSAEAHGSIEASSAPLSTASRINGRERLSQRQSRRTSFVDPIKAEVCGLSDHEPQQAESPKNPRSLRPEKDHTEHPDNADVGVCPIRFLDQHSPEEVASYFEKHKHELPRSHEVCVMRYQRNDEQVRELDAKYGNLVSMIQGLGQTHKDMLPAEPDEDLEDDPGEALDDAKVRKWASSVGAQAPEPGAECEPEERQPHFERPLRDVRVGESPSRPWGISVPAKYLEDTASFTSSNPAPIAQAATSDAPQVKQTGTAAESQRPVGKCPFGHGAAGGAMPTMTKAVNPGAPAAQELPSAAQAPAIPETKPNFISKPKDDAPQMVFSGPVFIGYSAEDAAKILGGLGQGSRS